MKKKKARAKTKSKVAKKAKTRRPVKAQAKVKKSSAKRPPARAAAKKSKKRAKAPVSKPKPGVIAPANGVLLGFVDDYFAKIGVIALALKAPVLLGQKIQVLGHTTIDHAPVTQAGPNDSIGIKVIARARCRDHVYLLK